MNKIVVISGPTASGKSQLAASLLRYFPGVIINADAIQVYDALPILTAQPVERFDLAHKLYGFLDPEEKCSAALWLTHAKAAIEQTHATHKIPIIVGGTGLYLKTLLYGISAIPDIESSTKKLVQDEIAAIGFDHFYQELSKQDPYVASLHQNDHYRITRAAEVFKQTGNSITEFHCKDASSLYRCLHLNLQPEREVLYSACNKRFANMLASGAIDEVKAFNQHKSEEGLAVEKAIGYRQISDFLADKISLTEAAEITQQLTRNYAKRQYTWFRHQMPDKTALSFANYAETEKQALLLTKQFL